MFKKIMHYTFLVILAFLLTTNKEAQEIISGIAFFLLGMILMEDGFGKFSGGTLQKILKNTTNTYPKALLTGFLSTSLVQSSSLITVIVISFIGAGILTLTSAVVVIFGANIGTTTTSWIVSTLGLKINISIFALPMIIFGTIFKFSENNKTKNFSNILIGLGFVFLGIDYMKNGFDTLKNSLDLAQFSVSGYAGAIVYITIGALATVIIQSSSATMAIIITALASGQIVYINALELSIGANIGTTITAVLASLPSGIDSKRLAVAHLIFNGITALVAIAFLIPLEKFVNFLAYEFYISQNDFAMKLALFHTIFNIIGVILVSPFLGYLIKFLNSLFKKEEKKLLYKSIYLNDDVIKTPQGAIKALQLELKHLFGNVIEVISHAIYFHRKILSTNLDMTNIIKNSNLDINLDINKFYTGKIKNIYTDIIKYSILSNDNTNNAEKKSIYSIKLASRQIVETVKTVKELQKNIYKYFNTDNEEIKTQYNILRITIAKVLKIILTLNSTDDKKIIKSLVKELKKYKEENDLEKINNKISKLIKENKITPKMASSLINDTALTKNIINGLIDASRILYTIKVPKSKQK